MPSRLRILGLDLAGTTGWCVMVGVDPSEPEHYDQDHQLLVIPVAQVGHFTLPEPVGLNRADRNLRQYARFGPYFRGLLDQHAPDVVAYEYSSAPRSKFGNARGRASASVEFTVMRQLSLFEGFLIAYANELRPHYGFRLVGIGTSDIHEYYTRTVSKKTAVWSALEKVYQYDLSGMTSDEKDAVAICRFAFDFIQRPEITNPRRTPRPQKKGSRHAAA